jgi:23S rRNA (guanine745-N1)-methyltransferase
VPFAVPAPLASIARRLQCPVCRRPLSPGRGSLICSGGHTYDVARQGYVTLLRGLPGRATGDDAGMVAARCAIQSAGHFAPLTAALADTAHAMCRPEASIILDVGAGTGHHLAGVLGALGRARGVALDASVAAARRAARAHPRIAAVRGDTWQGIPLGDAVADLALNVFAPRNGSELGRVLRPGGVVVVVTPRPEHLHELAVLHTVRVDSSKRTRLNRQLAAELRPGAIRQLSWTLNLTREEVEAMVRMGPAAKHLSPDLERRLAELGEPMLVTAAVELSTFTRPLGSRLAAVSVSDQSAQDRVRRSPAARATRASGGRRTCHGPGAGSAVIGLGSRDEERGHGEHERGGRPVDAVGDGFRAAGT